MQVMAKRSERTTVNNMVAFNDALKDEYGIIHVVGDAAETVRDELEKHSKKEKASTFLKILSLPLLLVAWPLAIAAFLLGGVITSKNIKLYKPNINDDNSITLTHKKCRVK